MLTLVHIVCQMLCLLCVSLHKLAIIPATACEYLHRFSSPTSPHNCPFSSSRSCVRPPATSYPTGPNQSDSSCGRHSGPQLCGIRKPRPHHPVEEGWCFGVHARLQGQTAGHGRFADTLRKGKKPAHMHKHAQIPFELRSNLQHSTHYSAVAFGVCNLIVNV